MNGFQLMFVKTGLLDVSMVFYVYMDGVVREVNVRVLVKALELLSANGVRFEIDQLQMIQH